MFEVWLLGTNNYKKHNEIEMRLFERNQDNNSYHVTCNLLIIFATYDPKSKVKGFTKYIFSNQFRN